MPLQWRVLPALALLILLACSGAATHAAPDPTVEAIQRALIEKGFDPGKIDGAMGWRTRGALRVFQRSVGLPDSGRTDTATLTALGLEPPGDARAEAGADRPQGAAPGTEPAPMSSTGAPKAETPRAKPETEPSADTPETEAPRTESEPIPSTDTQTAETPDAESATEPGAGTPKTEAPRAEPAPMPAADAPKAETPSPMPATELDADPPATEVPRAEPVPMPAVDAPKAETPSLKPSTEPDADTPVTEMPRAEPAPVPDTVAPKAETPSLKPATEPDADTPGTETPRTEPAPAADAPKAETPRAKPDPAPSTDKPRTETSRTEPAPTRAAKPKLSFTTLGWHGPQTGAEALERLNAIGAPRDFKQGTGSLFVPKSELVFVLKAGERVPRFDCDPSAGRLSIEFVFGPDGPVIFTPVSGGEYCQIGIGIAIGVGRTLDMRRVDWGDTRYPQGTVRITNEGLEYVE